MITLVHWKDVVGHEFLPKFCEIEKQQHRNDDDPWKHGKRISFSEEDIETYRYKRSLMRYCGYEIEGKFHYRRGWIGKAIVDFNGDITFKVWSRETDRPDIRYCRMQDFLDLKQQLAQEADEQEYYTRGVVKNVEKAISKPKPRKDIDGDEFIPEGEE